MGDVTVFRLVVAGIGLLGALALGGIVILSASGQEPPSSLGTVATGALAGLLGILVKAPNATNGKG